MKNGTKFYELTFIANKIPALLKMKHIHMHSHIHHY